MSIPLAFAHAQLTVPYVAEQNILNKTRFKRKMDVWQVLIPLIAICICTDISEGYFIHIDAHAEECFFDRVNSGSKMSLMFEVAEGGFLDIDVKVRLNSEFNSNQPTSVGRRSWSNTSVGCLNN